jgi:peptidoglycan/xylan/chitin deacetylase (PgdA/CDA1 family)
MRPDEQLGPKFLLYHDVAAAAGGDTSAAADKFRRHFQTLVDGGYRFAPMSSFLNGEQLGPWDLIITVDDGARSFIDVMLPALKEQGASALLFIVMGFMGKKGRGVDFLSWEDVSALQAEGIEFGSHGTNHLPLDEIPAEQMRTDILGAADVMSSHGFEPTVFAYPFGRYNDATKDVLREAGYDIAVTVMKGGYDRYEIRRRLFTGLENPTLTRFIMQERYFDIRETARTVVPSRFLRQDNPIPKDRWGRDYFGVED